ncbi:MAG: hypothetical protein HQ564_06305, partial [Candidatus Saganbacteria bacterium]|nr:hypothetical protein [Candidatus Saganbacteria bacterium]
LSEKAQFSTTTQADIWLKWHDLENIKFDFDYYAAVNLSKINVAQAKILLPSTDIIIGRQQTGWGVGLTVNPIDIINPKPIGSSFDPTFVRDGRDALVVTRYLDSQSKVELVYAGNFDQTVQHFDRDYAAKIKTRLFESDFAISYIDKGLRRFSGIIEAADKVFGIEMAGTIPEIDWGYWIEAARYMDSRVNEAVLGVDYYFGDWHPAFEYYRNGFGSHNLAGYDATLLLRGRLMGRDYLIPSCSVSVSEKLSLTGFGLINLNDSSWVLAGVADYFINDNLELILIVGSTALQAKVKWVF